MSHTNQLAELIAQAFRKFEKKIACDDLNQSYTYHELRLESEKTIGFLQKKQIRAKQRVGICAPKSYASYAALLGIIQSGGAYVPIDPTSPISRINTIVSDSKPEGVIGEYEILQQMSEHYKDSVIEEIPGSVLFYLALSFDHKMDSSIPPEFVCILYTSGSTGKPKGVMVTHENAFSYVQWAATSLSSFSAEDVFSSVAPFYFALSLFDLYVPLVYGAQIVLFSEKHIRNPMVLSSAIEKKKITVWYSTPSVLMLMMQYGKTERSDHSSIRLVCYAGEVFPSESLRQLRNKWPDKDIYNQFGSTETNVCTSRKIPDVLPENFDHRIIGNGCSHLNCKLLVNDVIHEPTIGTEGELVISGPAVSPGYFGTAAELSGEKFITIGGNHWYRMGDWAIVNDQQEFKLLGRIDRMVKKRGNRIELDEIEKAIAKHALVDRSGVVTVQAKDELVIKAFIETVPDAEGFDLEDLQRFVRDQLPNYMIPDVWGRLDKIPLTSTHKIDYQSLKAMDNP
ncbi:MAG: amino acid adenylation domain-containing protein [Roseivirga sp.]|nr:amino acid adenylation domain-containing protein [Roseivirga sp.]